MSAVTIRPVLTKADEKTFIKFPWAIMGDNPVWVPPLLMDRKKLIDRKNNPFYKHAELEMFLAERDGKTVGRIAAIVNDNHIKEHNEKVGFWGFFDCVDDQAVANALFDAANAWLKAKGMEASRGPASPSVNDDYGLLIEGFDKLPAIMMTYNPPYYQKLVEACGFAKAQDLFAYHLDSKDVFNDKFNRIVDVIKKRGSVTIRKIDMKRFDEEVALIRELYAKGWQRNWGEVPMTEEEFTWAAKDLKSVVDPNLIVIAESKGKPIGFGMTLPDLNQILVDNRGGHLLPAIFRMIFFKKRMNRCRIVILGVLPEYQNTGAGSYLFYETGRLAVENGYPAGEASWVNEDNIQMNRGAELMQGVIGKKYRIYQKNL
jgi:GNAT superfamily N-acetyltransferase